MKKYHMLVSVINLKFTVGECSEMFCYQNKMYFGSILDTLILNKIPNN